MFDFIDEFLCSRLATNLLLITLIVVIIVRRAA